MTRDGHHIRNAERTRAAVLKAAAEVLAERGTGASLARIAEVAGVSKSGLLHHFANREQLIVALLEEVVTTLRQAVMQQVDASDERPGRLMRAYIRALCTGSQDVLRYFSPTPVWAGVLDFPEAIEVAERDSAWWAENLAADGLSPQRVLVVRRAAEEARDGRLLRPGDAGQPGRGQGTAAVADRGGRATGLSTPCRPGVSLRGRSPHPMRWRGGW